MNQLVSELKKIDAFRDKIKVVALTSRKGLCVHPKVKKIESSLLLTEKCEDLTEKGNCPYKEEELNQILASNIL